MITKPTERSCRASLPGTLNKKKQKKKRSALWVTAQASLCSETTQDGFGHHRMADDRCVGPGVGWGLPIVH